MLSLSLSLSLCLLGVASGRTVNRDSKHGCASPQPVEVGVARGFWGLGLRLGLASGVT